MKAKVYCERCKKYEMIEIIQDANEANTTTPIPKPNAGLKTYSVVHNDHILIADIDKNGDVRTHKIIERIGIDIERLVSSVSSKIMNFVTSPQRAPRSLVIVSRDKLLKRIIVSVSNQLMLNINENTEGRLIISSENTILEYDLFRIYIGSWREKILNVESEKKLFAYHLTKETSSSLIEKIHQGMEQDHSDYYAILFDTIFVKTNEWKEVLREIVRPNPHIILSDVGDPLKAVMSVSTLIDKLLSTEE